MRSGRRSVGAGALAGAVVAIVAAFGVTPGEAAAPGKVKVGVDRATNVSFSINGRTIDVVLRPVDDAPNPLAQRLSGMGVAVACKGTSPRRGRVLVAELETAWPTGAEMMRGRLSRDVSVRPQWCVLEEPDGTDIAVTRKLRTPRPTNAPATTP